MSKKKYRPPVERPAPQPQGHTPQPDADLTEAAERLNAVTGEALAKAGAKAAALLGQRFEADSEETLSDGYVRRTLKACVAMATQVVEIASAVLGTVDVSTVRKISAGEFKLPAMMRRALKAAGIDPTLYEGGVPEPAEKPEGKAQRRPRGAKHPLVVLMQQGLQAVRLVDRITRATNPGVYNLRAKAA